jgi:hypothetical protein
MIDLGSADRVPTLSPRDALAAADVIGKVGRDLAYRLGELLPTRNIRCADVDLAPSHRRCDNAKVGIGGEPLSRGRGAKT